MKKKKKISIDNKEKCQSWKKKKKISIDNKEKCQGCNNKPSEELHTCPYKEEINEDHKTLCNCCKECTQECCWDI